ncbi:ABC transporter permease subunit [Oerskovia sp. M15]
MPPNPWFSWSYVQNNWEEISQALVEHTTITIEAVLIALVIALPSRRSPTACAGWPSRCSAPRASCTRSLARAVLDPRPVHRDRAAPRAHRPRHVRAAHPRAQHPGGAPGRRPGRPRRGEGLGYGSTRLLASVEMPNALPSIMTGVRLATVSTVALVTVGFVAGYGGLGTLMFRGFRSSYNAQIMTATLLCLLLAVVLDLLLMLLGRALTPWSRTRAPSSGPPRRRGQRACGQRTCGRGRRAGRMNVVEQALAWLNDPSTGPVRTGWSPAPGSTWR